MRKVVGVFCVAAMALSVALVAPAGAAGGTTCKPATGKITLSPGLTSKPTVQTITINLPVTGCSGGGSGPLPAQIHGRRRPRRHQPRATPSMPPRPGNETSSGNPLVVHSIVKPSSPPFAFSSAK